MSADTTPTGAAPAGATPAGATPAGAAETAMADALGRIATAGHLLVALDFDGTLAPEVDAPRAARALPEAQDAILRLVALPDTSVALVSGRALDSLIEVAEAPNTVLLVGSHGVEYRVDGEAEVSLSPEEQKLRGALETILTETAAPYDDVHVEEKPAGFALHTRLADESVTDLVLAEARRRVAAEAPAATERVGKNVLEFAVRSASKGDAIARLREITGASAVFFAGDDVTDEDGFRALAAGDFGLKSGHGDTAAAYRVAGPPEVAHVLDDLAELRAHLGRS
ncbi:trehalose 6-phosphate phosphatase [Frondihabitans sucicola]|uniref:Trehalose 6-phosphate phosphatase n=1 Tax=Frondihabitans sucicola TaxID=1268041 RepID=A0ABN6Y5Q8_9MICO|nr:trehalose-phosphatase [Frondihabitans sucicola]BDZ51240.1 trehalose 6-phosphate phosphatase [Frondihabitans sucicola]